MGVGSGKDDSWLKGVIGAGGGDGYSDSGFVFSS